MRKVKRNKLVRKFGLISGVFGNNKSLPTKTRDRFERNSEYSKQLKSKQKIKATFCIREKQMKRIVKLSWKRKTNVFHLLSLRLDNVIFESGLCRSKFETRQTINHNNFKVNDRVCNKPSRILKVNDRVCVINHRKLNNLLPIDKKIPTWIDFDRERLIILITNTPNRIIDTNLSFYTR